MRSTVPAARSLEEYREQVAALDASLVMLYLRRRALVRELMAWKSRRGLPPFDPAQEEKVIARARLRAQELGASETDAERLIRWVLEEVHRLDVPMPSPTAS